MSKLKVKESEYDNIVALYNSGFSKEYIQNLYKVSNSVVDRIFRIKNVQTRDNSHKRRIYSLNENYFDIIDTANKAYILGLLYADGCNYRKMNSIKIELQEKDKSIIYQIQNELESSHPIKKVELSKKNKNWQDTFRLMFANKHMSEQLEKLGVVQNKSLILTYPKWLDKRLFPHFLRGYFDGDGYIEWNKSYFLTIAGTLEFCESVQEILLNDYNVKSVIYNTGNKESNTKILNIMSRNNIYNFLNLLYNDSELHIDRKYQKYLEIHKEMNSSLSA